MLWCASESRLLQESLVPIHTMSWHHLTWLFQSQLSSKSQGVWYHTHYRICWGTLAWDAYHRDTRWSVKNVWQRQGKFLKVTLIQCRLMNSKISSVPHFSNRGYCKFDRGMSSCWFLRSSSHFVVVATWKLRSLSWYQDEIVRTVHRLHWGSKTCYAVALPPFFHLAWSLLQQIYQVLDG